ncbi:hypothetical protein AHF37_11847 [Paragonimus kellicotti]|nr:hypothetical protein AHF37_11847 [Paragonimus kellicotti]
MHRRSGRRCDVPRSPALSCLWKLVPWSPWSECSASCGTGGTQSRQRQCDNPAPTNGGRLCSGKGLMVRACNRGPCPVNGGWGEWSPWSHCSKSCGGGQRRRTRRCDHPAPAYGGEDCPANGYMEVSDCQDVPCPVNGEWSNWSSWSACSRTCGIGLQTRERECSQPSPQFGGRLCPGSAKEVRTCEVNRPGSSVACPGSGASDPALPYSTWTEWSAWSTCEPDCLFTVPRSQLGGWQRRTRTCRVTNSAETNGKSAGTVQPGYGCPGPVETCNNVNSNPALQNALVIKSVYPFSFPSSDNRISVENQTTRLTGPLFPLKPHPETGTQTVGGNP